MALAAALTRRRCGMTVRWQDQVLDSEVQPLAVQEQQLLLVDAALLGCWARQAAPACMSLRSRISHRSPLHSLSTRTRLP